MQGLVPRRNTVVISVRVVRALVDSCSARSFYLPLPLLLPGEGGGVEAGIAWA